MISHRRGVLGSSFALVLLATSGSALAQNTPTVQGIPPVSSPNIPTTPAPAVAPRPAPPPPAVRTVPAPAPATSPTLTVPSTTPGGTSVRQLGAGAANEGGPLPPAPQIEAQMTALIGRPGGLTADQAATRARATSYDVQAKKHDVEVAGEGVSAAGLAYVPRINAKASYTRLSDIGTQSFGNLVAAPEGTPAGPIAAGTQLQNVPFALTFPNNNYNLEASVDVPLSDYVLKLSRQYAAAEHSQKAAELTQRAAEMAASSNARISYYSWARARLNLVVAQAALDNAKLHLADAKAELAAGKASQADLMAVQAELAQTGLLVTRATNAVTLEEDRLRTAMHDAPEARYEIGEALLTDLPPVAGEDNFNATLDEALHQRPELRAITETAASFRSQARAEKIGLYPRLDGVASAQYANPNPRYFPPTQEWHGTWAVGASLSWSAQDAILGGTSAGAADARASAAESQALQMRDGIRDEVMQGWQAVHESESAIKSTQESLAAAEESYRVRRALFRADRATSTELTDSENALTRARFESVNARIDLRIARVRLAHATGRDDVAAR